MLSVFSHKSVKIMLNILDENFLVIDN